MGASRGWFNIPKLKKIISELQKTCRLFFSHFPLTRAPKPQPQTWTGQHEKFIPAGILLYLGLSCQDKNCTPYPGHNALVPLRDNYRPRQHSSSNPTMLMKLCAEDSGPAPQNKMFCVFASHISQGAYQRTGGQIHTGNPSLCGTELCFEEMADCFL